MNCTLSQIGQYFSNTFVHKYDLYLREKNRVNLMGRPFNITYPCIKRAPIQYHPKKELFLIYDIRNRSKKVLTSNALMRSNLWFTIPTKSYLYKLICSSIRRLHGGCIEKSSPRRDKRSQLSGFVK